MIKFVSRTQMSENLEILVNLLNDEFEHIVLHYQALGGIDSDELEHELVEGFTEWLRDNLDETELREMPEDEVIVVALRETIGVTK